MVEWKAIYMRVTIKAHKIAGHTLCYSSGPSSRSPKLGSCGNNNNVDLETGQRSQGNSTRVVEVNCHETDYSGGLAGLSEIRSLESCNAGLRCECIDGTTWHVQKIKYKKLFLHS